MKSEFTAIIETAPEGGYWAICPEVSGANGQGETINETKDNLRQSIKLILEDRRDDFFVGCLMMPSVKRCWLGEKKSIRTQIENCWLLSKTGRQFTFSLDKPKKWSS